MTRLDLPRLCLWIALALALVGTVGNTAWAFGTVDNNAVLMSYIKAIALDVGMVAVAATLAQRKRAGASTRWLWIAVVCFVLGSMYANYLHGQEHLVTLKAHWEGLRPVILSALLPLMLFALVEIVAHAPLERRTEPHPAPLERTEQPLTTAPSPAPSAAPAHEPAHSAPVPVVEVAPVELPCDTCDRTFGTPNALRAHKRFCAGSTAPQPTALNGHAAH